MNEYLRYLIRKYREQPKRQQHDMRRVFSSVRVNGSVTPRYINSANTDYMVTFKFSRIPDKSYGLTKGGYLLEFLSDGRSQIIGHVPQKYVPRAVVNHMTNNDKNRMFHANRINNIRNNISNIGSNSSKRN